jgi:hypothetical protein
MGEGLEGSGAEFESHHLSRRSREETGQRGVQTNCQFTVSLFQMSKQTADSKKGSLTSTENHLSPNRLSSSSFQPSRLQHSRPAGLSGWPLTAPVLQIESGSDIQCASSSSCACTIVWLASSSFLTACSLMIKALTCIFPLPRWWIVNRKLLGGVRVVLEQRCGQVTLPKAGQQCGDELPTAPFTARHLPDKKCWCNAFLLT